MSQRHDVEIIFGNWIDLTGIRTSRNTKYYAEELPNGTIILTPQAGVLQHLQEHWNPYAAGTSIQNPPIPDDI